MRLGRSINQTFEGHSRFGPKTKLKHTRIKHGLSKSKELTPQHLKDGI